MKFFTLALALEAAIWFGHFQIAPPTARQIKPPAIYQEWFTELVACVGTEKTFEALTFYVVPGVSWRIPADGSEVVGYHDHGKIYMAETYSRTSWLVKHEMTHYLLLPHAGHPAPPFEDCEFR